MTYDELLDKINEEWGSDLPEVKFLYALRAVVGVADRFHDEKWVNEEFQQGFKVALGLVIQAIEKELK